jgi:predicted lysophospholipase L1 biosynthesis ABC-type transport system permease subunit
LPEQVSDARAHLQAGVGSEVLFRPMVRGRLVALNGAEVDTK